MRTIYDFENGFIEFQDEWDEAARSFGAKALDPNQGRAANLSHWLHVAKIVKRLQQQGWQNIRVDQQQVKGKGAETVVGPNRPDISAVHPRTKERLNIEVDTNYKQSEKHQREVIGQDPHATSQFILINPKTGKVISSRIH